ncbi:glycosylphosphatidylinositol anchor attachment 1 protein isoform X2 [Venturia canescens]|uniref:glycosylphosphatidylinositol anchor attachment 1 protein isoform X2 n=1 Tax=Venturia canescens TaxID=32260 RepID=UPI001C9BDBF3|nr:glycosylphosphatidylinositol anchor attachment 1 protein isoform X2 [Venturia canescens]
MGLLTDPRASNVKMIKFILQWEKSLCFLMYISGIVWMCLLALPTFNDNSYFSENALLPGLVMKGSNIDYAAYQYYRDLKEEMKLHPDGMPYPWILAKLNQLHLDVYTHNFTLNYPFRNRKFTGQNVYGIMRAPRAASTEAIVVSVPYRALNSVHPSTAPSVALLLAFAQYCRKQKYWAKDIIFLITEHEQLGMQAWLDAYHGVTSGQKCVLIAGDLTGRAGSIQAAINLEIHTMKVGSIDVKVEGLNGQLPNLDLFNLAENMINKEGISRSFQRRFDVTYKDNVKKWWYHFNTLMAMVATQAAGVPTGNHGLFHRFGIEAVTLEGFKRTTRGGEANFSQVGRVVESIVRSLNNLLERFHQSFFFYLLPSTDRYISIGLYMPCLVLIIGSLFIKAYSMWLKLQDVTAIPNNRKKEKPDEKNDIQTTEFDVGSITSKILWIHLSGVAIMSSPKLLTRLGVEMLGLSTENSIYGGFAAISALTILRFFVPKGVSRYDSVSLVCVIALVELATALMCVAMHNFSLALVIGVIYVPIVLHITPKQPGDSKCRWLLYTTWTLLHPFVLTSLIVMFYTYGYYSEEKFMAILGRGLEATKSSMVFGVIDSMIYGNWLYNVTAVVLLPIWLLLSSVISNNNYANCDS